MGATYTRPLSHRLNPFIQQLDRFLIDQIAADHWHPTLTECFDSMHYQRSLRMTGRNQFGIDYSQITLRRSNVYHFGPFK